MKKIKNIFFDFDGVVAESVKAKTDAFKQMYLKYGSDIAEKVVVHHINNGGVSRYEKFKIYHESFLNIKLTEKEVLVLAHEFSKIVMNQVINSELVKGVELFLTKYSTKIDCRIITGTPTNEMGIILKEKKLDKYFLSYHGSPEKKKYWTEFLINKYSLNREEILFLGDASTDKEAAEYSKLNFALRVHGENKEQFINFKGITFSNFIELENEIKNNLN